jgi:hypothetical protein
MSEEPNTNISFGPCCLCGGEIAQSDIDPCRLTVETQQEKWQVWFCHGKCFKENLFDDSNLEPAHF